MTASGTGNDGNSRDDDSRRLAAEPLIDEELRTLGEQPLTEEEHHALLGEAEGEPIRDEAAEPAAFLLSASQRWDLTEDQSARGRRELMASAEQRARAGSESNDSHGEKGDAWWRKFWVFLPLPALAALGLFVATGNQSFQAEETTQLAEPSAHPNAAASSAPPLRQAPPAAPAADVEVAEEAADDTTPRGISEQDLIQAQMAAVQARLKEADASKAAIRLDAATRGYRAQLLAQLEREER